MDLLRTNREPRRLKSLLGGAAVTLALIAFSTAGIGETVQPAFAYALPNEPGKVVTGLLVTYLPGEGSHKHHHSGSVVAYILSGAIRSQTSLTGAARVYHAGESFFEPPGSTHLTSENASATEPASLLAVFVADEGAKLKTDDP